MQLAEETSVAQTSHWTINFSHAFLIIESLGKAMQSFGRVVPLPPLTEQRLSLSLHSTWLSISSIDRVIDGQTWVYYHTSLVLYGDHDITILPISFDQINVALSIRDL